MRNFECRLPWPPSINSMYRSVHGRNILSAKARKYKKQCDDLFKDEQVQFPKPERVALEIIVHPPDRRRRDISNLIKIVEDALPCFEDDCQVDDLHAQRADLDPEKNGFISVKVSAWSQPKLSTTTT